MVRLEEHKNKSQDKAIEGLPLPKAVYIPMSQHLGRACIPQVKTGDTVLLGQKIGSVEAAVYAPIHSSLSGKVTSIQDWPHPVLGRCKAIVIESNGLDKTQEPKNPKTQEQINKLSADEIRNIVFEAGIVGMGGASFPTHIKLNPPKPVDTLIINGAECEPYLTADYRLMVEKAREILQGVDLVARCLTARKVFIAIEDNKPEAIKAFESVIDRAVVRIVVLRSMYPQGGEKQLIKNILGKEVPRGKLPFDIGVSVQNVATVFAVYEAVYSGKPLYERVVTVTGSCVSNPKNILVRIGTPVKELLAFCGPLKEKPAKIIIGGPMMGIAQYTDEVPVVKSTTGIVLMNEKEAKEEEEVFCIRCAACVRACPAYLSPTLINLASRKEIWESAKLYGASDCIECGLCSYVCPSNIKLVQAIKRAKLELTR